MFGPRVSVAPMMNSGIELAFGIFVDPQFGPLVMVAMGGRLIELMSDRAVGLAPFDREEGHRLLSRLRGRPLLDGLRGAPPVDVDALARALAQLSVLGASLSDCLKSLDANPIIAGPTGCVAADALVVGRGMEGEFERLDHSESA